MERYQRSVRRNDRPKSALEAEGRLHTKIARGPHGPLEGAQGLPTERPRGRQKLLDKLQVLDILFDSRKYADIAADYEISRSLVAMIKQKRGSYFDDVDLELEKVNPSPGRPRKLTMEQELAIVFDPRKTKVIAEAFHIPANHVRRLKRGDGGASTPEMRENADGLLPDDKKKIIADSRPAKVVAREWNIPLSKVVALRARTDRSLWERKLPDNWPKHLAWNDRGNHGFQDQYAARLEPKEAYLGIPSNVRIGRPAKLSDEDVLRIARSPLSLREAAARFGVSYATISKIRNGKYRPGDASNTSRGEFENNLGL